MAVFSKVDENRMRHNRRFKETNPLLSIFVYSWPSLISSVSPLSLSEVYVLITIDRSDQYKFLAPEL